LLHGKAVVKVNPEIADKNVESELRPRAEEQTLGIVARVVQVEGIAKADVQSQGIQLRHRPEGIDHHLGMK
jgi:hypothetical protein